jgi:hypothetical protein
MMVLVVLAICLGVRARGAPRFGARSAIALVTALLIKAAAAALVPILLAAGAWRRFLAGSLLAIGVFGLASLIAFGVQLPDVATQNRLVTAIGIPNVVGLALGQGGETANLHVIFTVAVVLAVGA